MKAFDSLVFRLAATILGPEFKQAYVDLERSQWMTDAERQARMNARLTALLKHAAEHVPFYRNLYQKLGMRRETARSITDLRKLPIMCKDDYRGRLTDFLADNLPDDRRIKISTSGSTGQPFSCYWDRTSLPMLHANHIFSDTWYGFGPFDRSVKFRSPRPDRVAEETSLPLAVRLRETASGALRKLYEAQTQLKISAMEIGPVCSETTYRKMESFRPLFVSGYTSAIATTAQELLKRNLRLSHPVRQVITEAEPLTPERKHIIEEYFSAPVANRYGIREQGAFTMLSCPKNPEQFHIITEQAIFDVVHHDGTPVKPGKLGRLLVTDLLNFAMPLIRYDTGDLAIMSDDLCSCGRTLPVMKKIEGRSHECFMTPSGFLVSPGTLGHFLFVLRSYADTVLYYQLLQSSRRSVSFLIVPGPGFDQYKQSELQKDLEDLLDKQMDVVIEIVKEIPVEKSGKRPVIKILNADGKSSSPLQQ